MPSWTGCHGEATAAGAVAVRSSRCDALDPVPGPAAQPRAVARRDGREALRTARLEHDGTDFASVAVARREVVPGERERHLMTPPSDTDLPRVEPLRRRVHLASRTHPPAIEQDRRRTLRAAADPYVVRAGGERERLGRPARAPRNDGSPARRHAPLRRPHRLSRG